MPIPNFRVHQHFINKKKLKTRILLKALFLLGFRDWSSTLCNYINLLKCSFCQKNIKVFIEIFGTATVRIKRNSNSIFDLAYLQIMHQKKGWAWNTHPKIILKNYKNRTFSKCLTVHQFFNLIGFNWNICHQIEWSSVFLHN